MSLRRLLFSSLVEGDGGGSAGEKRAGGVQKAGIEGQGVGFPRWWEAREIGEMLVAKCT